MDCRKSASCSYIVLDDSEEDKEFRDANTQTDDENAPADEFPCYVFHVNKYGSVSKAIQWRAMLTVAWEQSSM